MKRTSSFLTIKDTKDHGQALVTTRKLSPGPHGLLAFSEKALLNFPTRDSPEDKSGPVPDLLAPSPQLWADWWFFQQQPEDIKIRVLDMYTEMECPHACSLRHYLEEKAQRASQEEEKCSEVLDNIEDFVRLTMVVRFNAVELCPPSEDGNGPGTDYGHGLFEKACKMSHSCKPNCVWMTSQDGKEKLIRAITTIEKGEELTVDYVGQSLSSVPERREELLESKGFLCNCDRCAAKSDDTRRFACIRHQNTNCHGWHNVRQDLLASEPIFLPCNKCGTNATQEFASIEVKKEYQLWEEVKELGGTESTDSFVKCEDRIMRLDPPHHFHSLAERCYELQGELHSLVGDYQSAAEAYSKQIHCRNAILGNEYHSQATAFTCEKLGDALMHVNVEEAEEAYKRTVRSLQIMRGDSSDPYSRCAINKLLEVQNMRIHSHGFPNETGMKGIADPPNGPPNTAFPCELCGNPSVTDHTHLGRALNYCCSEHQRMHLSVLYDTT